MLSSVADNLIQIVDRAVEHLRGLAEEEVSIQPAPGKWSKKEILGHLIDSAANNHHRFIRAQLTDTFRFPDYQQPQWVDRNDYAHRPWLELVEFWRLYNRHLAHVMRAMNDEKLETPCYLGNHDVMTLRFIATDYSQHLLHHLRQLGAA